MRPAITLEVPHMIADEVVQQFIAGTPVRLFSQHRQFWTDIAAVDACSVRK